VRKDNLKQQLLISIRGKNEAIEAFNGGAHIIDVEYPESALGTPYPLNIKAVRKAIPKRVPVATNIGEEQLRNSTACQAALGVALAGADIIKAGLAGFNFDEAEYLGLNIVRTIKEWFPEKQVIPAVFADRKYTKIFDPIVDGPALASKIKADGILIDTYNKDSGKSLLDLMSLEDIKNFVASCHRRKKTAWIAGSITKEQLPKLWLTKVDVICIRGAACESNTKNRLDKVDLEKTKDLSSCKYIVIVAEVAPSDINFPTLFSDIRDVPWGCSHKPIAMQRSRVVLQVLFSPIIIVFAKLLFVFWGILMSNFLKLLILFKTILEMYFNIINLTKYMLIMYVLK